MGDRARARQVIEEAVGIAAPDGLISPLMSFSFSLEDMPDEIITVRTLTLLSGSRR